ncbi:hypothetical protein GALMADRAFT_80244 [Galerina marginata CBS 339.88]|uniref:DUF202 domain-containing protein n=1 Tax=Galerina marginata (strain CBS 339.88) TaxID=685588 RepID=A0A067SJX1_GALM3|nr:hypothetical protein GALMADRAFT_80244 [Galerina marginata CBS 339.88]
MFSFDRRTSKEQVNQNFKTLLHFICLVLNRLSASQSYFNTSYERPNSTLHSPRQPTTDSEYAPPRRRNLSSSEETKPPEPVSGVELRLLNVGSVARDHLASERTFLAYVRTSLGLCSAGIALMQFLYLGHATKVYADPLGAALVMTGLLVLFIGTKRYFLVQRTLTTGYFPASSFETYLISFLLGSLITAAFAIILAGRTK